MQRHRIQTRHIGLVQARYSDAMRAQADEIRTLKAERMRLRGRLVARATALACALDGSVGLADSLAAADLGICEKGSVSQHEYRRVDDHCRRTVNTYVLVDRPEALRIIHERPTPGEGAELTAAIVGSKGG